MDIIKNLVFTFCSIMLLSTLCNNVLASNRFKTSIRAILALVLMTSILMTILGSGYKLNVDYSFDVKKLSNYKDISSSIKKTFDSELSKELEKSILNILSEHNIKPISLSIQATTQEYNKVNIKYVEVILNEKDYNNDLKTKQLKDLINDNIENTTIIIKEKV